MIYVIGGSPRSGKSSLAKALSKETSIPYISADDIGSVITPYIPEHEQAVKFPMRTLRKETNFSNDIFYSKYTAQQIVGFYQAQAETLWPGFKNFINYVLIGNHDYILEGWQILPFFVHSIITPENEKNIKVCFLYKESLDDILTGIKANTAENDWAVKNTKEESTYSAIAKMVSFFGNYIKTEAEKNSFKAVNMDFDFNKKINELSKTI